MDCTHLKHISQLSYSEGCIYFGCVYIDLHGRATFSSGQGPEEKPFCFGRIHSTKASTLHSLCTFSRMQLGCTYQVFAG